MVPVNFKCMTLASHLKCNLPNNEYNKFKNFFNDWDRVTILIPYLIVLHMAFSIWASRRDLSSPLILGVGCTSQINWPWSCGHIEILWLTSDFWLTGCSAKAFAKGKANIFFKPSRHRFQKFLLDFKSKNMLILKSKFCSFLGGKEFHDFCHALLRLPSLNLHLQKYTDKNINF